MTLYLIGIGLNDEKDISVKGLEAVRKADKIFLEDYTSMLQSSVLKMEEFYDKKIILAERDLIEKGSDDIILPAKDKDIALLIVGDVFGATTHTDFFLRAKEANVPVKVINNASILNAIGIVGLELYKFGKTTSQPYWEDNFKPETAYDVIKQNKKSGLHTLVLLDIKPERKMTVNKAIEVLETIEKKRDEKVFTSDTLIIGCARIGGDFKIKAGTVDNLREEDFGQPLHCLIVPGNLHFIEEDMLKLWK